MQYADVILPLATPPMTFAVEEQMCLRLRVGMRVMVQLGARKFYSGIVWRLHDNRPPYERIKSIVSIIDEQVAVLPEQLRLWEWIANYYMCPLGMVMRAALPAKLKLDGYSEQETLHGGYHPPKIPHVGLVDEIDSEEKLHAVLDRLGRAKTQYKAVTEYLARVGFALEEPREVPVSTKAKLYENALSDTMITPESAHSAADSVHQQQGASNTSVEAGQTVFGSWPLVPRESLGVSNAIIRALVDRGVFCQVELEASPQDGNEFVSGGQGIAPLPQLTTVQQEAYDALRAGFADKEVMLLHGVTGSGKTEIYIHLMAERLAAGGNVLYMLPEIALTTQLIERMRGYFGDRVIVYHSRLTDNRRAEVYRELLVSQGGRLVIGVRSSVLLPLPRLALVVIDEEHENSFKQSDSAPRYQARDTAIVLASFYGAKCVLGSATPSMESYFNAQSGKYGLVTLTERYGGVSLPQVLISDTLRSARRGEKRSHFNKLLLDRIDEAMVQGQQVMYFRTAGAFHLLLSVANVDGRLPVPIAM